MLTVPTLADATGQWVNEYVRLLTVPKLDGGRYTALAQVGDALAIVEVRVTQIPPPRPANA
jgi:hypothetical protein